MVLVQLSFIVKAQAFSASYEYDDNGNRKTASVTYLTTSLKSDTVSLLDIVADNNTTDSIPSDGWAIGPDELQGGSIISLYPNPTYGMVLLKVTNSGNNITKKDGNYYSLWDITGKMIKSQQSLGTLNTINLSSQPNGIYIVRVSINGQNRVYRIVKE